MLIGETGIYAYVAGMCTYHRAEHDNRPDCTLLPPSSWESKE